MNFPPNINLFLAAVAGAYLGLFAKLPIAIFVVFGLACVPISVFAKQQVARAIAVLVLTILAVASISRIQLEKYRARSHQIPGVDVIYEGVLTNLSISLENKVRADFRVTGAIVGAKRLPLAVNLVLTLSDAAAQVSLQEDCHVRVRGRARAFRHALSPGEFDAYWYGFARSQDGLIAVHKPMDIVVMWTPAFAGVTMMSAGVTNGFSTWRSALRNRLLELTTPREAAVLLALIIGDIRLFDSEQTQIYRDVGAGHLLAVSGLQVSILAFIFFRLFQYLLLMTPRIGRLSRARPIAACLTLIAIWIFTGLCGAPPSAMRAAGMATVMLLGVMASYRVTIVDAFGLTGFLTVVWSPGSVVDPSFMLSYSAVLGLLIAGTNPIAATIGAGILTIPISAHLFGSFSLGGLLVNMILIPVAVALQTPAIFFAVIGAAFHLPWLVELSAAMAGYLEAICDAMGRWLGYVITLTAPSGLSTVALFIASICVVRVIVSKQRTRWLSAAVMLLAIAVVPTWSHPNGMRITLLPVGQGDSTVFEFPSGQVMLVDGGGSPDMAFDPGRKIVIPFLKRHGIKRIDVMVVTHPHVDHILGLLSVASNFEIGEIWHSGFASDDPLLSKLLDIAQRRQIRVRQGDEIWGAHQFGDVKFDVMAPHPIHADWSPNNNSLVMRFEYGQDSALWPGDAEQLAESELLANGANLKSTVVKAGHHGSKTSSSPAWVAATNPRHVIFCTQEGNQWGFPHSQISKRWQNQGAHLWNTGTHGEITIWMTGSGVRVKAFLEDHAL